MSLIGRYLQWRDERMLCNALGWPPPSLAGVFFLRMGATYYHLPKATQDGLEISGAPLTPIANCPSQVVEREFDVSRLISS
jgi:hypothetical protein